LSDQPAAALTARLDKWLWMVRVFKTRSIAATAIRLGSVRVAGEPVKPSRDARSGEELTVRQGIVTRTLVVRGVPQGRVGAKLVAEFCEERTPPEEWARAKEQRVQQLLARDPGAGRPTKRDRREMERLWE
jgi:ribosome-associated heat shock protein Hsp15